MFSRIFPDTLRAPEKDLESRSAEASLGATFPCPAERGASSRHQATKNAAIVLVRLPTNHPTKSVAMLPSGQEGRRYG